MTDMTGQGSRASRELQTRLRMLETAFSTGSTPKPVFEVPITGIIDVDFNTALVSPS